MASRRYTEYIHHSGLNKSCVITADGPNVLEWKKKAQLAKWDEQWQRKLEQDRRRAERARLARQAEDKQRWAEARTRDAEAAQTALGSILTSSLRTSELKFDDLRDDSPFVDPKPLEEEYETVPPAPLFDDQKYHPNMPLIVSMMPKKKVAFEREQRQRFEDDLAEWRKGAEGVERDNAVKRFRFLSALFAWSKRRDEFLASQEKANAEVDALQEGFRKGDPSCVTQFCELALSAMPVPIDYPNDVAVGYDGEAKSLVVDYRLPTLDQLPNLKKVTYVKSRDEYKEYFQTDSYMKRLYESVTYQLVMRVIKCVSTIDKKARNVDTVVVNGWVSTVDRATGHQIEPYVLSVSTSLSDFRSINLSAVDPRAWFKSTKGVSAASIASVTPIAPIVTLDREDRRFVDGYEVVGSLDDGVNLAAMDWQDFENLVRELFEEELSASGGEVKITRASRDGGVDAVAFDPDPIRGGKIVIQAKRYTNTVGVSAVRDLYGTVMNEGAMKGILVTTSDYGSDAYEFARGKPLTLLNGGNLLSMLERHGHRAHIDLSEARIVLKEQQSDPNPLDQTS